MTAPSRSASVHESRPAYLKSENRKRPSSSRASLSNSPFSFKTPDVPPSILRKTSRYPNATLRPNGVGERKRPSALQPSGRSRFASLPFVGSSTYHAGLSTNAFHPRNVDFEHDRLAKACGQDALSASASTPTTLYDMEDYPLNYHSKSRQSTLSSKQVQGLRSPRCRTPSLSRRASPPPAPPFPYPSKAAVFESLENDLATEGRRLEEFFVKGDGRENCTSPCRRTFAECPHGRWACRFHDHDLGSRRTYSDPDNRVFHVPLELLSDNAVTTATVVGYKHVLPVVVVTCVEELYRTGIYQRDLFRALPDRPRLSRLEQRFNQVPSEPLSTHLPSLSHETTPNICSLLGDYVASLPEPPVSRNVFDALWSWSINPPKTEEPKARRVIPISRMDSRGRDDWHPSDDPTLQVGSREKTVRRAASDTFGQYHNQSTRSQKAQTCSSHYERELYDLETPLISIASHLLLLLPPRSFSLIVYLFSFFSQLTLSPENGLTFEDVARIFAPQLLGGPSRNSARVAMVWLLDRWSRILEGFENLEDHMQQPVDDSSAHDANPSMANKDTKVRFFDEITDSERADALHRQESRRGGRIRSYSVDRVKLSSEASKGSTQIDGTRDLKEQMEKLRHERDDMARVVWEIRRVVNENP